MKHSDLRHIEIRRTRSALAMLPVVADVKVVREVTVTNKILLFVDDRVFAESLRRQARKSGLAILSCFNLSDFWQILMTHRHELVAAVLDHRLVNHVVKSSAYERLGRLPIAITGHRPTKGDLPFQNAVFVHKGFGATTLIDTLIERSGFKPPVTEASLAGLTELGDTRPQPAELS